MPKRRLTRALWAAALAAPLLAGVASASEVVAVRVGSHPTFTRVVFELDAPAGYRVERRELPQGGEALVVTLDAESSPRSLRSGSVMVERVELSPERERTSARIRLRKAPVRIKELILADPPRIVFDLVLPESDRARVQVAQKPPAPSPPPEPSPAPSEPEPAPTPAPITPIARPAPTPAVSEPEVEEPAPPPAPPPVSPAEPLAGAEPEAPPEAAEPEAVAEAPQVPAAQPEPPLPRAPVEPQPSEPEAEAAPERKPAAAPRVPTTPAPSAVGRWLERIDPLVAGGVAAGVLLVLLVLVLVLRRRGDGEDIDVVALAEAEEREEALGQEAGFAMGDEGGFAMGEQTVAVPTRPEPTAGSGPEAGGPRDIAAGPGLFDDESEKESETMDSESPNLPLERGAAGAAGAAAAGDTDVVRLVRELERRVAQLETRLDESIDARQRLERQVAAQSEELRVQRTAIARTQRALRSLNRGDEEQATEPALREPSK